MRCVSFCSVLNGWLLLASSCFDANAQAASPKDDNRKSTTMEYRELQPTIDTVETMRLLSADRAEALEKEVEKAYLQLAPSVVRIWSAPIDQAFTQGGMPLAGSFSGVIIDRSGLVCTCSHPGFTPGSAATFELHDGRRVAGKMLGRFELSATGEGEHPDLGLAQITAVGDWPAVEVAEQVHQNGAICLAIGYPGGLHPGRAPLLRVGRLLPQLPKYPWIRATTAWEGGDSGGPLFDLDGRLLGVLHGGDEFAGALYEPAAQWKKHRAQLMDEKIVLEPRTGWRVSASKQRDPAPFAMALDLESKVNRAALGVVRILAGKDEIATGFLIDRDGWLVTKRTLLHGRTDLKALTSYTTTDRALFPARRMAESAEHDVALLKLDGYSGGPVAEWATEEPRVGQLVVAFAHTRSQSPAMVSVVAATAQPHPPAPGDVAQFPFHFVEGPNGETVIAPTQFRSAELDATTESLLDGDVITHLEGTPTPTLDEFGASFMKILYAPAENGKPFDANRPGAGNYAGEPLQVTILRNGTPHTVDVTRIHSTMFGSLSWHSHPRSLRRDGFPRVFSIDARLRPDQCGGPVVDRDGRVLGITIARADGARTLVLPADVLRAVVTDLRRTTSE